MPLSLDHLHRTLDRLQPPPAAFVPEARWAVQADTRALQETYLALYGRHLDPQWLERALMDPTATGEGALAPVTTPSAPRVKVTTWVAGILVAITAGIGVLMGLGVWEMPSSVSLSAAPESTHRALGTQVPLTAEVEGAPTRGFTAPSPSCLP
jgi:hypothetical protein